MCIVLGIVGITLVGARLDTRTNCDSNRLAVAVAAGLHRDLSVLPLWTRPTV